MSGHIIVCGEDALARRIIDELGDADVRTLQSPTGLAAADVATADAVICASTEDSLNLEMALLARRANPGVRVVARIANPVLRQAMDDDNGPGSVLDVADLAAPSVLEALLGRTAHTIRVAAQDFVVSNAAAAVDGTLREIYGRLAPVAVVRGANSPAAGDVLACPPLDTRVCVGDWITMIGRPGELADSGMPVAGSVDAIVPRRSRRVRFGDSVRAFHHDLNPMFYRALAVALALLIGSTLILRFAFRQPDMGWVDALSFATETLTTVGYGDFNFALQATWLRLWGVVMMLSGIATNAILVAFIADVLLSRRMPQAASREKVSHLRDHVVVVGLGSFGVRVAGMLREAGHDVAMIELDEDSRYLPAAAELGIPVIFGDATLRPTLAAARVSQARAVAVLTENDMVNIETGIILQEMLSAVPSAECAAGLPPIVLRIYDRELGAAVGHRLGFEHVRSTVDLATPWFIGAAMGMEVLGTFSVGQHSFMIGGVQVQQGSEMDGMPMLGVSTQTRIIAVERRDGQVEFHPHRDARLSAGDTAYLVGPYRELLETLRRGGPGSGEHGYEPVQ
jgi:Trk K+ transport system NAD-binding subunit